MSDTSVSPVRALRAILGAAAAAAILVYLGIALIHLRYPHEIEWIEGGMVDEIARLTRGEKLYVEPTVDYVPFIYAPLWFHVAALFSKVFGVGFFAARLVSVVSSMAAMALIAAFIHRETKDRIAALAGAGLYAATYPIAASFYDLARVDSLFVALLLGGLYVLRFRDSHVATIAAAALFALAFFTKQSAPIAIAPIALHLIWADRRRGLLFSAACGAMMGGGVLAYNIASDGWFWHFCFVVPSAHTIMNRAFFNFWAELGMLLGFAYIFAACYVVLQKRSDAKRFYLFAAAGMLGAALAGHVHRGAWSNVLSPAYAVLAVLFGLGLHALLVHAASLVRAATARAGAVAPVALSLAVAQLAVRAYDPRRFLASAAHAEAWRALIAEVQSIPGDVFVSAHGFVGPRAGKRAHAHQMAISDELRSMPSSPTAKALRLRIARAIEQRQFAALVLDNVWLPGTLIHPRYEKTRDIPMRTSLGPVIGWRTAQPSGIWVPKP